MAGCRECGKTPLEFRKMPGISWLAVSFSGRTLLHVISWLAISTFHRRHFQEIYAAWFQAKGESSVRLWTILEFFIPGRFNIITWAINSQDPLSSSLSTVQTSCLPPRPPVLLKHYSCGILSHVTNSWGDISLQSIRNKNPHWMFEVTGRHRGCGPWRNENTRREYGNVKAHSSTGISLEADSFFYWKC